MPKDKEISEDQDLLNAERAFVQITSERSVPRSGKFPRSPT